KKRKALTVFFPILAMVRTRKLNKLLKKLVGRNPVIWRIIFTIGVFVSFVLTVFGFYFFTKNLFILILNIENPPPESQVAPLIPGLTIGFETFLYLIIPLLFVITSHELAHAISANTDNIPVKSTGIFGLGIFFIFAFGAFVEIDDKAFKTRHYSRWSKLRLAAAGTFFNVIIAVIALIGVYNFETLISPLWGEPNGIIIRDVYTAEQGGYNEGILHPGDIIYQINGTRIPEDITLTEFLLNRVHPNDSLDCLIYRDGQLIEVIARTGPHPNNSSIAFMGITSEYYWPPKNSFASLLGGTFPNRLIVEVFWLYLISFNVALFNMMPLPICDGDKVVSEIVNYIIRFRKEERRLQKKYYLDRENPNVLELENPEIKKVEEITIITKIKGTEEKTKLEEFLDYQLVDANGDGNVDHVHFALRQEPIPSNSMISVQFIAEMDVRERLKKIILNVIRIITVAIVAGNFIISGLTLGIKLPFM
ncbi:MAG: site-2 protease family protein, partial [Promethearchaeota archaeon]